MNNTQRVYNTESMDYNLLLFSALAIVGLCIIYSYFILDNFRFWENTTYRQTIKNGNLTMINGRNRLEWKFGEENPKVYGSTEGLKITKSHNCVNVKWNGQSITGHQFK